MNARRNTVLVALVCACVVSGCALPTRDNPNDPYSRPRPALSVSPESGTRQTYFTISAADSSGGREPLTFAFDLDGDPANGFEAVGEDGPSDPTIVAQLTIPTGALGPRGEGSVERLVRVEVRAGESRSEVSTVVLLSNLAPIVDAGPHIVSAPELGSIVDLDGCGGDIVCASYDPDEDGLSWTWRQVGGAEVALSNATTPRASFVAPLEPQVLYFELEVSDGLAVRRERVSVRIGTTAWVSTNDPDGIFRIHPDAALVRSAPAELTSLGVSVAASRYDGSVLVAGAVGPGAYAVAGVPPNGEPETWWNLSQSVSDIVSVGEGACVRYGGIDSGDLIGVLAPPTSGTSGTFTSVSTPTLARAVFQDPFDDAACIAVTETEVRRVRLDGTSDLLLSDLTVEEGTPIVQTDDGALWLFSNDASGPSATRRDLAGGMSIAVLGTAAANSVQAVELDSDSALVFLQGDTLRTAFVVSSGASLQVSVPPFPLTGVRFTSLREDGSIYALSQPELSLRRLVLRGTALEIEDELLLAPLIGATAALYQPAPDPWGGGVAFVTFPNREIVRVSAAVQPVERVSSQISASIFWSAALEPAMGSLWVDNTSGVPLTRLGSDGRLMASAPGGTGGPLRPQALPDGGVQVFRGASFERYDRNGALLTSEPLPAIVTETLKEYDTDENGDVTCLTTGDAITTSLYYLDQGVWTELAAGLAEFVYPVAAPDGSCWFTPSGSSTLRRAASGGVTDTFDVGFAVAGLVVDPRDGSAWVGDFSAGEIQHIAVNGSLLERLPTDSYNTQIESRCAPSQVPPDCAILWGSDENDVVRRATDGTELQRFSIPGATSVQAIYVIP